MQWLKQGIVFSTEGQFEWMKTHAQVPVVLPLSSEKLRIYFSTRPQRNISLPACIDFDLTKQNVTSLYEKPLLPLGKPGTFDEHGVMPACVIHHENTVYLYYTGWSRGTDVPYTNAIGLAVSRDGGVTFKKCYEGPIVDRTRYEPYSAMSPYIIKQNNTWHMWYGSGINWFKSQDHYEPIYIIKYAHSKNGIDWIQENHVAINQNHPLEAITRPTVLLNDTGFHMWFCYRGSEDFRGGKNSYRIGYAFSKDGIDWKRNDMQCGIKASPQGWDSEMVEYPYVIGIKNQAYMFYNGNGFGQSGFGYALLSNKQ